ncbi:MAG: hypothetical protein AMJ43_06905 [Coxiella sp. DG_40]|nr:MAG: hypothetical protein AMJ43_06905 [Coxiella sp. DG_40]
MHQDHQIFIRAVINNKKVLLNYFDDVYKLHFSKLCTPLYYSPGNIERGVPDYYYLWDLKANAGKSLLRLPSTQIVSIEPTEEAFDPEMFIPIREGIAENKAGEYKNDDTIDTKESLPSERTQERESEIAKLAQHLVDKIRETGPTSEKKSAEEIK